MNGKGDDRRPTQVSESEFEANWRRTFGEKPVQGAPEPRQKSKNRGAAERAARRIGQRGMFE